MSSQKKHEGDRPVEPNHQPRRGKYDWWYDDINNSENYKGPPLKLPEKFFPMPYRKGDEERYPGRYVPIPKAEPDLVAAVMGKGAPYMPLPKEDAVAKSSSDGTEEKPWPPLKVHHQILFLLNED